MSIDNKAAQVLRTEMDLFSSELYELSRFARENGGMDLTALLAPYIPVRRQAGQAIAFRPDVIPPELFRNCVARIDEILTASASAGRGGRDGMIAALRVAMFVLERLSGADLEGVTNCLAKLGFALSDLDSGAVHTGLRPPNKTSGRKSDARREEFKMRCTCAAMFSTDLGHEDAYDRVFDAACEAATIGGYFKRSHRLATVALTPAKPQKRGGEQQRHKGEEVFTATTIRRWHQAHIELANKENRETAAERRQRVRKAYKDLGYRNLRELDLEVWLRSLKPSNMERSFVQIALEFAAERSEAHV